MTTATRRRQTLIDRARTLTTLFTPRFFFYNLDNFRGKAAQAQVKRELRAMAKSRPHVIALCEVTGNTLPDLPGYTLIRDKSRPGRENLAAYVRNDMPLRWIHWTDLQETWSRTQRKGTHPARSILTFSLGWLHVIVAHQPPKGTDNTIRAQREGLDALTGIMAPWTLPGWSKRPQLVRTRERMRPRLLLMDGNRRVGEPGPGPDELAKRIGGKVHNGKSIDHAVSRRLTVLVARMVHTVKGVPLHSDHHRALYMRVSMVTAWLPFRRKP